MSLAGHYVVPVNGNGSVKYGDDFDLGTLHPTLAVGQYLVLAPPALNPGRGRAQGRVHPGQQQHP